jgi:DNA invertase Pin-like site-specific DNA recombinase
MRVALYARYSSDQQRAASIADQQRICREFAARQNWQVVASYEDAAFSGSSLMRPGFQALMRAAPTSAFDLVLAESLDRFSRDQEDTAGLFKRLTHAGVRIVTVSEGEIGHLHVGLKGTMNALYLHDLAEKTRRGLRGRVEAGRSGGGISFGYRVVRALEGQPRGDREIDDDEAAVVRRIYRAYVSGVSPKAIAKMLNAEGIPGPAGTPWSPSTIHGHAGRGTGLLNNELYIGRLVWNRQRYVKDPDTGKRVARINPAEAWIVTDVPHLRILDDDLWHAAKARQAATRYTMQAGIVRARRPKFLFSGLTRCECCGGGFVLSSHDLLTCFNARARGTCTNRRSIKRQDVEGRVLRAMRHLFFEPGLFAEFCRSFAAEMTLLRREHVAQLAGVRRELAAVERRLHEILKALSEGFRSEAWKAELVSLDARKAALTVASAEPPLPAIHPKMAEVFRQKVATLAAGLEHDDERDMARQALRGFLEKIVIPPADGLLKVIGNVGTMLATAQGRTQMRSDAVAYVGCGGSQPTLSAALAPHCVRVGTHPDRALAVLDCGALSHLDNIAVRIADVASDLAILRYRRRDELRSSTFP